MANNRKKRSKRIRQMGYVSKKLPSFGPATYILKNQSIFSDNESEIPKTDDERDYKNVRFIVVSDPKDGSSKQVVHVAMKTASGLVLIEDKSKAVEIIKLHFSANDYNEAWKTVTEDKHNLER